MTILHVDDDPKQLRYMSRMAVDRHHVIEAADSVESAEVALNCCRRFDAAIIDIRLPGRPGTTLFGALDEREIPTVLYTAHPGDADTEGHVVVLKNDEMTQAQLLDAIESGELWAADESDDIKACCDAIEYNTAQIEDISSTIIRIFG